MIVDYQSFTPYHSFVGGILIGVSSTAFYLLTGKTVNFRNLIIVGNIRDIFVKKIF
jgi:hypothetical protein